MKYKLTKKNFTCYHNLAYCLTICFENIGHE